MKPLKSKIQRLLIQSHEDRKAIVKALSNSGYLCWCTEEQHEDTYEVNNYVLYAYIGDEDGE